MRFAIMLATAAVVPLLTYGVVSVYSLRDGTARTVVEGNLNVARQVGEQVRRYMSTNIQILQALAADLENTGLTVQQQDRILKNYALRFPEFRELTIFNRSHQVVASSRVGPARAKLPPSGGPTLRGVLMSPVFVDDDLMPTTMMAAALGNEREDGWLVGEFSIEELWRMTGRIRVGAHGFALIVGPRGELLAHGDPEERSQVARGANLSTNPTIEALRKASSDTPVVQEYTNASGYRVLDVGVRIPELDWMVVVEQPKSEAFAVAWLHERELIAAISLALLVMVLAGSVWGRSMIRPIAELIRATKAISIGHLDERVNVTSGTELGALGHAFNSMADRLVELQEDVRKQERHAMFGRVAAGLVHDLSHPFKNVQNNCRLVLKMHDDPEYRELFRRTVEREFASIKRVFEDLRNIAKPMPLEHFPVEINKLVSDVAESMKANAESAGLSLELNLAPGPLLIEGDVFALGRVCRNLVLNAIEATLPQGRVTIATETSGDRVRLRVSDTGCGIPPERVQTLFEDFQTTKRQGLGLGLAIAKKIVDQLGGTIALASEVGKGAAITLEFPRVPPPIARA